MSSLTSWHILILDLLYKFSKSSHISFMVKNFEAIQEGEAHERFILVDVSNLGLQSR